MQTDFLFERYGFTLIGLICGAFLAVITGTMLGEWIGTDIGLLNLWEIHYLAVRTGFAIAFAGSMMYLVLLFTGEGQFPLPGSIAWHGLELFVTIVISVIVVVYGLDGMMPWYRQEAPVSVPMWLFVGLFSGWVLRFFAKRRLL